MKRIVEIKENDVIHYEVQYKFLFWWRTYIIEDFNFCSDGIGSGFDIAKFLTLREALLFVNSLQKKPKVVWQSNK